ncbi:MAG: beta-propeller domain-containing protein [Lachnospiraceae bacterium]|nr:beta-propeller domain-containing protein [Lachnospiraceae bacterium]
MDENKLFEDLKKSAEKIEIPEGLTPEKIGEKLEGRPEKSRMSKIFAYGGLVAAAAVVVVVLGVVVPRIGGTNSGQGLATADTVAEGAADETVQMKEEPSSDTAGIMAEPQQVELEGMLTAAADYEEVYNKVASVYEQQNSYARDMVGGASVDSAVNKEESAATSEEVASDSAVAYGGSGSGASYSETNIQEAGVDEGDVVKTDGEYIYVMNESNGVRIIKADGANLKEVSVIDPKNNVSDSIFEMYVDGDTLVLMVHRLSTDLLQQNLGVYSLDNQEQTCVLTYDISDRTKPVLKGEISQDGYYQTSRKIGDYVYLFTEYNSPNPCLRGDGSADDAVPYSETSLSDGYIPRVNQEALDADSIFLPKNADSGTYLIMTSVDLKQPEQVVNSRAILSVSNKYYVSQNSIYIETWEWNASYDGTSIVKVDFADGVITPKAASTVPGYINDSFSMSEYDGHFRVVTTDWSREATNGLYIFDENMQLTGKVDNLAPGEQIQSARFMGDKGYFVTYRNMDPLFCVDLSDVTNPVVLDELKVTGFSQYLHFYGENKLLGMGYETDPETSERKGLKLSMFDISDLANLSEVNKAVLENVDGSSALDNYKALMIDDTENVIGFMTYDWDQNSGDTYMIFSYDPGEGFVNEFAQAVTTEMFPSGTSNVRGMFIGDTFYLVGYDHIYAYDRTNGYAAVGKLS